jgi:hypothetical protein
MTDEEQVLLLVREQIAGLSEEDQIQVKCIASTLRNILKQDTRAPIAFALVGAELAAES